MARDYQNFPKNTRKCKGVPEIITKCQKFQESTRNFKKALEITRKGHRITESTTNYQKLQGSTRSETNNGTKSESRSAQLMVP